jgi:hypothetical protein
VQRKPATQSFSASRLSIGPNLDADRNQRAHLAYRGGCPLAVIAIALFRDPMEREARLPVSAA